MPIRHVTSLLDTAAEPPERIRPGFPADARREEGMKTERPV